MIQLKTIKILTETNQKTDRNWLKTLCHPQGPSKSRSLSSNRRSLSSKLKSPSFTRSLTWRVHIYIYTYLYLYYIYLSLSLPTSSKIIPSPATLQVFSHRSWGRYGRRKAVQFEDKSPIARSQRTLSSPV